MKTEIEPKKKSLRMGVRLASHYGMCFGVRDALRKTFDLAGERPGGVTVLGQLVHNPVVDEDLRGLGVAKGALDGDPADTRETVVVTAHGASDRDLRGWRSTGRRVVDTTCPLVRKAHGALAALVDAGYQAVVIGRAGHVEVQGLVGDFPGAVVVESYRDLLQLPQAEKFGVVSQTTQPLARVRELVEQLERSRPAAEVRFIDTVCQPTKDRQQALIDLCAECDTVVVVGGANSNNTGELARRAEALGARVVRVERSGELQRRWFRRSREVGVTAGTSTLDETVRQVFEQLQRYAAGRR